MRRERGYTSNNKVELVKGGEEYFNKLKTLINQATTSLHLQVYIYQQDETGKEIATALIAAARRKVKIYLLADGYASQGLSKSFIDQLERAGINFRFFNPLFKSKSFYFGRRLHHKVTVVDATYALVGGINITNRYNDMPNKPGWLDFALYVEGEAVIELFNLCNRTWNGFLNDYKLRFYNSPFLYSFSELEKARVRVRINDWVRNKNQISGSYIHMLANAREYVTILCSYFLPGRIIRKHLAKAAKRGVKIQVIMAGVSDVMLAKYAERFIYTNLLKHDIKIYEYQKNILHGKIAICDDEFMTIGSYNVNNISAYASIELNLDVRNESIVKHTANLFNNIIQADCININEEYLVNRINLLQKIINWASYKLIKIILYIFTFYFKKSKN